MTLESKDFFEEENVVPYLLFCTHDKCGMIHTEDVHEKAQMEKCEREKFI